MPRLKVFATTSGIHDHVVAAPSRPAALKAWGAKTDLFSMGVAKQVSDPRIVKKALASPGEVISLTRSGDVAHESPAPRKTRAKKAKLAAAEKQLERLAARHAEVREALEREARILERKREQLDKRQAKLRRAAEEKVEEARETYQAALDDWSA